jgi:hypothetical protein
MQQAESNRKLDAVVEVMLKRKAVIDTIDIGKILGRNILYWTEM